MQMGSRGSMRSEYPCLGRRESRKAAVMIRLYVPSLVWGIPRQSVARVHTCDFTPLVLVGSVYLFVFRFILWAHIPVEAVLQPWGIILVLYPFEFLWTAAAQSTSRVHKVGFRLWNEPVRQ